MTTRRTNWRSAGLLAQLRSLRRFRRRRARTHCLRLRFEPLEQRCLLAVVSPLGHSLTAEPTDNITITLAASIDPATVTSASFVAHASQHGELDAVRSAGGATATLDPTSEFAAGELIQVTATSAIRSSVGAMFPELPYVWQFRAGVTAGTGNFLATQQVLSTAFDIDAIAPGDFDRDGFPDIVAVGEGPYEFWQNNGAGIYVAHGAYPSGGSANAVDVGDLNGDGYLDFFVAEDGPNRVWLNNPSSPGHFLLSQDDLGSADSGAVRLGDVDGDGDLDAYVVNWAVSDQLWLNNGNGVFVSSGQTLDTSRGADVELGDLDNDGDLDAIVISARNDEVDSIWSNDGLGRFTWIANIPASESRDVALGDVDGDGDLDCYIALAHNLAVPPENDLLLINQGGFTFTSHMPSYTHSANVQLGDADGDGDLDALLGGWIYLNDGLGSFAFTGQRTSGGYLVDANGDGALDVLGSSSDGPVVWLNEPRALDFGDAPNSYGTFASAAGAAHVANALTGLHLGLLVDSELDGQPGPLADGDDNAGQADDDGVLFKTPLLVGDAATIAVAASQPGLLSAWIDWNQDGDWNDPGERIFTDEPVQPAVVKRIITVPGDAVVGQTYARFRVSSVGNLAPTGYAQDGEVEDYVVTIGEAPVYDWGDAPVGYATLATNDGPVHTITSLYLGAAVDAETDGQPSAAADGDNLQSQNDERGVHFNTSLIQGRLASVTLTASESGFVDGWIDFDRDGSWGAGEQVLAGAAVHAGRNTFNIDIPATALEGRTFARFRLSSMGGLGPTGLAADGEVEDYAVDVHAAVANLFALQQVTDIPESGYLGSSAFNADGTIVVFGSQSDLTGENPTKRGQLFLADLNAGTLSQLTHSQYDANGAYYVDSVRRPSVNADGSMVAYISYLYNDAPPYNHQALSLYNAKSDSSVLLQKAIYAEDPRISSDGEHVLYWRWLDPQGASTEYHIYDINGSPVPQSIFASSQPQNTPVLSADGTTVAVVAYDNLTGHNPAGVAQLFLYDVPSDALRQLTDFAEYNVITSPSLSADGSRLAFVSDHDFTGENPTNTWQVFVMETGSGTVSQLTAHESFGTQRASLSADGTRLVYAFYENDLTQIYLVDIASGSRYLVTSTEGFSPPQLNADGTRIMFTSPHDLTGQNPDGSDEVFLAVAIPDKDADGIGDEEEDLGPNGGDGNNDQIPDSQQPNVTSLVSSTGSYVTLESPTGTQLAEVAAIENPSPDNAPPEEFFPLGFFRFEVHGLNVGGSTTVSLIPPTGTSIEGYYKHGALPSDPNHEVWYRFDFDGTTGAEFAGDLIVLHFVDGGRGDSGITGDGKTVDPGGPAMPAARDFGDAPEPGFPTLLLSDGARHGVGSLYLGDMIDADADGQPDAAAGGDDTDGTNDDDGISFGAGLSAGLTTTIAVQVNDFHGVGGYLDAWVDWNQDGIWSEPDERALNAEPVTDGENQVAIIVPATALSGETCARFRLSSTGELPMTGFAADGEVEDFMVTIAPTWTNPANHLDVSNDTHVVAQDALMIINYLNDHPGDSAPPPPPAAPPPFYDVTGDGNIVAQDAIWIINYLNEQLHRGDGESDSSAIEIASVAGEEVQLSSLQDDAVREAWGGRLPHANRMHAKQLKVESADWHSCPMTGTGDAGAARAAIEQSARPVQIVRGKGPGRDRWLVRPLRSTSRRRGTVGRTLCLSPLERLSQR